MLDAARAWTEKHGRPPSVHTWKAGTVEHPSQSQAVLMFGSWGAFVAAAGHKVVRGRRAYWTEQMVVDAFLDWLAVHGRWPTKKEWYRSEDGHPDASTVGRLFGSWTDGRRAAGYTGSAYAQLRTRKRPTVVAVPDGPRAPTVLEMQQSQRELWQRERRRFARAA